ncbi:hypothetical protein JHK85_050575 [Glycine max]|nr:hypothetical protein JHK85_050575 [Glycine max]
MQILKHFPVSIKGIFNLRDKTTQHKSQDGLTQTSFIGSTATFCEPRLSMSCLQFIRSRPLGKTWSLIRVVAGWVVNNTSLKQRCIGALDGTHISVRVSPDERPRYRNRKGDVSTNVLAACGPNLRFIYVLSGWEGSAGDSRVLRDALRRQNKLEIPTGKYFLVDAGFTNGLGFLAPYQGTRYHLNEWIGNTPQSYKELFNIRHASARNAIERDEQQTDQLLEVQDLEFLSVVDEELVHQSREEVQNNVIDDITTIQATEEWTRFRDTLAMNMFANY